ncbi:MAG: RNA methyltransferase [Candidatus Izimaplasma sp.]|nr:RNA methyltransferase [Candidatus Izimaplasma bacterium]
MKIRSLKNQKIIEDAKLNNKKYRDSLNLFLVEGYHLYEEAKKYGVIKRIYTIDETIKNDNVFFVTEEILKKLTNTKNPQGIVCVCEKTDTKKLSKRVLLLDNLQDPGNLGTLIRSCIAFGFDTIVLDESVDPYNDKVLRSTQGGIFKVSIIKESLTTFIQNHSEYFYVSTSLSGKPLNDIPKKEKIGLIIGNEGSGISSNIISLSDFDTTIKMKQTESLNAAVAGSIIMHHLAN